ncbi:NYN domain-containing protein [Nocardia neocaledoniensis]|uniref:NYN domain-containing protein n=1 Tax=Nocardia neocaledoniensis TaxID=236511 RepID=UPI00245482E2|nr:NYN domain-containing protein [Nocardia neocaledoniensis]
MGEAQRLIVVDAANVVGSRADGWWKDRAGAARRLLAELADLATRLPDSTALAVVLEGAAKRAVDGTEPTASRMTVVLADHAGDDTIVEVVAASTTEHITVVTADRELRSRVEAHGAATVGPTWLRDQLG